MITQIDSRKETLSMEKARVYFTKEVSPEAVLKMYRQLGKSLPGKVAVKLHSGEEGNQNYLPPSFMAPVIEYVGGTVVECNTAYEGRRNYTDRHLELLKKHGWSERFTVDLMDAEGPDMVLPVENGFHLKENYVGKNLACYDSLLVLSHFKGHPMGGYGGALKQLSIGCASTAGKCWIHSVGLTKDQNKVWDMTPEDNDLFTEAMADAASSVVKYFGENQAYVSAVCNLSVDCDCCEVAEDPCMKDIGVLSSTDPVALDRACLDLIYAAKDDPGQKHFLERVQSRRGEHIIEAAVKLGFGSSEYELICTD